MALRGPSQAPGGFECKIAISQYRALVYIWGKDLTFWQLLLFVQGWVPLV